MRNKKHVENEKSEGDMRDALPVKLKVGERHGHELGLGLGGYPKGPHADIRAKSEGGVFPNYSEREMAVMIWPAMALALAGVVRKVTSNP